MPGITEPASYERGLPSVIEALQEPDGPKRAAKLSDVAQKWFDAHKWYYRESVECAAMDAGAQWGFYSARQDRWLAQPESRDPNQVRLVINIIKPIADQAAAIMTQEQPIFGAAAATSEGRDSAAGAACDELLSYFWRQHRLGDLYRTTARDAFVTGTSFVLVEWDGTAGFQVPVGFTETAPAVMGEDGTMVSPPQFAPRFDNQGDLKFSTLMREQVAFDPAARADQDGVGILIQRRMGRAELRSRFPQKFADIAPDDGEATGSELRLAERATQASVLDSGSLDKNEDDEATTVYTWYLRASPSMPKGKAITFYFGDVLDEQDNPVYPDRPDELWPRINWPVLRISCDERANNPWGRGRVVDIIHLNKALNGLASKAVQHAAIIANAKVMLPKGLDAEWTDEMGQVVRIGRSVQSNQIGYINPPAMPQEYGTLWSMFKAEAEYIAGVNSSTQGQSPTSDASGRAIQSLQQRDYARLSPVKRSMDATWGEAMRLSLQYFRRYATMERKLMVVGENHAAHLRAMDGAQIANSVDVQLFNDQSIPSDPTQRILWLTQFAQTISAIVDPKLRTLLMNLYRLHDFEPFLEQMDPHGVKAERENLAIMEGSQPVMWEGDDHIVHLATLERLILSEEYERKVASEKASPEFGGNSPTEYYALTHYYEHKQAAVGGMGMPGMVPGAAPSPSPSGLAMPGATNPAQMPATQAAVASVA